MHPTISTVERAPITGARAARRKKFRAPPADAAARAKQSRFLEYRGFDAAQIRHALTQAANDEDL